MAHSRFCIQFVTKHITNDHRSIIESSLKPISLSGNRTNKEGTNAPVQTNVAAVKHFVGYNRLSFTLFITLTSTSCANSSGSPSLLGNGVILARTLIVSS